MKYFTYQLIAAANDWIEQTAEEYKNAGNLFWSTVEDYHRELDSIKTRVSRPAWNFFRNGFAHTGLHDATLISSLVGDGLDYKPDGSLPFDLNRQRATVRIQFLNYEEDFHYLFHLRGVKTFQSNLFVEEYPFDKRFGDLFTYELTAFDGDYLQLGFIFASGASIICQFKRLVFRRSRIKRK